MTGEKFIEGIVRRLKDRGHLCTDQNIVSELRSLDRHEVAELSVFGDVAKWIRENQSNKKGQE